MKLSQSILALSIATSVHAQIPATPAPAAAAHTPPGPPIRKIATASAVTHENFGTISSVLELRDGRVLVNDPVRRRLIAMDSTLAKVDVVLDSLSEVANTYGPRAGTLIPYRGDSILFVDPSSYAIVVLDPAARFVRVRSVWRVQDQYLISSGGTYGWPAADATGRIVYRVPAEAAPPKVPPPRDVPYIPPEPDSAFIVAVDIGTRHIDTLASIRIPKQVTTIKVSPEGMFSVFSQINPMPTTDDWTVLSDGTVALIRGRDYRVEYRNPDGTWTSSAKLPFDWMHYTEEAKQQLVDSVKQANERQFVTAYVASMIRWVNMYEQKYPPNFKVPADYRPVPGMLRSWKLPPGVTLPPNYIYGCAEGEEPKTIPSAPTAGVSAPPVAMGPPGAPAGTPSCIPQPTIIPGNVPPMPVKRDAAVVPVNELPDYKPPFTTNSVRADMDGNIWVRINPPKPIPGGNVYDIISRNGELTDRLQLPPGYAIVGFGRGKVVYVSMRDAKGIQLARVRLK